ncbi:MAG: hypothetical protein ABJH05_14230 [Fulvivirga sp.]
MNFSEASKEILTQLKAAIEQIASDDFKAPCDVLNNTSIGQHTRHTLEFFLCLKKGLNTGNVDYDKRDHDPVIESDKILSLTIINDLIVLLDNCTENVSMTLSSNYDLASDDSLIVESNLFRELAYNIEHAIHHMALIKIGLKEVAPYVEIPNHFGVAISTIKHKKAAAES